MIKKIALRIIAFYQRFLNFRNPLVKFLFLTDSACRFRPTCSQYCYQAVKRYGILKGGFQCAKRVLRCHPFSKGGWDPVE